VQRMIDPGHADNWLSVLPGRSSQFRIGLNALTSAHKLLR
jgi:hypothetical protein